MKKVTAIFLAALMALSLFACSGGAGNDSSDTAVSGSGTASGSPGALPSDEGSAAASGVSSAAEAGFFNPNTDYSKNQRYKVVYMVHSNNVLNQGFSDGFQLWADRSNCDYQYWSAHEDSDLFVTTMQTLKEQGVNGVILDPEPNISSRVYEVVEEMGLHWMPGMTAIRDDNGKLLHPFVGFDFPTFGRLMAEWLIDYAKTTWNLTDFSKVGFIGVTLSTAPQLHERIPAEEEVWLKNFPDLKENFMVADCVGGRLDAETSYNLIAPMMSRNTKYEYWLIAGSQDDWCDGAARAAESMGKADKTVVISMGGTGLIAHWDAGEDSCWKAAIFTAQPIYSEPIFMALYDFMNGTATPETIWPDWVDHSKDEKYASLLMTSYTLTKDNYKEYLGWVNKYVGFDVYPQYVKDYKGTLFDPRGVPPESFKG